MSSPRAQQILSFFGIILDLSSPQQTIQKIEMKVRELLHQFPEILLPCMPANLSSNSCDVADFFEAVQENATADERSWGYF